VSIYTPAEIALGLDKQLRPDILVKLLLWRMTGTLTMKTWTIEVRADFADQGKYPLIDEQVVQQATHLLALTSLIKDRQPPQVICYSDDTYKGHQDLLLNEDTLGKAIEMQSKVASAMAAPDPETEELLSALKDLNS
jgi:hypothetical protein